MTRFQAYAMAANATRSLNVGDAKPSVDTDGFLPSVSGTLAVKAGADGLGADLIPATPVTAGTFTRFHATWGVPCAVVLSGGAAGTLFAS